MAARVRIRSGDWRCPEPTHANLICRACGRSGIRWGRDQRPPCKCESVWASIRSWTSLLAAVSVAFLVSYMHALARSASPGALHVCTPTHHQAPASARRRRCAGGAVALFNAGMQPGGSRACLRPGNHARAKRDQPAPRRRAGHEPTGNATERHACMHAHARSRPVDHLCCSAPSVSAAGVLGA
jgi:hypothetical protein